MSNSPFFFVIFWLVQQYYYKFNDSFDLEKFNTFFLEDNTLITDIRHQSPHITVIHFRTLPAKNIRNIDTNKTN
ncbi:hypothetical protein [Pseudoalteromonas sp. G4]|uniref:hypothetical protein n=1 Tax=Pseudoalteromonas sp. G4 TaxID=2992761 RepID=UPI00237E67C2|nr:hypothetical protein [Pseudoalteromonas sp. G4]MDE3273370.1 hypothetical protein [Pseudoalteromonas sp. G4]